MSQEKNSVTPDDANLFSSLEGHLDAPTASLHTSGEILLIAGWLFSTSEPIQKLILTINDQQEENLPYKVFRPDVRAVYPQYPQAGLSGFLLKYSVPVNFIGRLNLKIWAIYADSRQEASQKICVWHKQVNIRPENFLDKLKKQAKEIKNTTILGLKKTSDLPINILRTSIVGLKKANSLFLAVPQIGHQIYRAWQKGGIKYVKDRAYQRISSHPLSDYVLPDNWRDWKYHITLSKDTNYQVWLNKNYPNQDSLRVMVRKSRLLFYQPTISIILPVYNPPLKFLRAAIESVMNQVYPCWELCIADDASTNPQIRNLLEEYITKDPRIKVVFRPKNGHISACSNSALELATGEFVALLDHDDLLTLDALYEVVSLLNKHPEADMIYSDEDKVYQNERNEQISDPFFKPDWCPDSFLSRMYTCHLGIYRRELVNSLGGFRLGYEGSQDYDLVLRLTEKTNQIFHIPKVLYHWRDHLNSTASSSDQKPYAVIAAEKALLDALDRRGELGQVLQAQGLTKHHVIRYKIKEYGLVSIIIPTKDLGDILDQCLISVFEKTTYPNYEVILIDNNSEEEYTQQIIAKWQEKEPQRFRCHEYHIPFNYSKINNYAVSLAKGDYLLFLNNDIEVTTPDWVDAMVEQAQRPSIGAVGALLLYPDDTIQHAGVVVGLGGVAGHSHKYYPIDAPGYFNQLFTVNNYLAVTAACLMCRREVFVEIEGFEEKMAVAFNDVDLCLKMIDRGYKNLCLPHVVLYHHESKSRGHENTPEKQARFLQEINYMRYTWKKYIDYDPCYSVNLTLDREDYSMRI